MEALRGDVQRWGGMVHLYLAVADGQNGSMHALPYEGGILEQPNRTMQVFLTIQGVMRERIAEEAAAVPGGGSRRRRR